MNRRIEEQLGRTLDIAARHSVATLNDVSPEMLDDLRRLEPVYASTYLEFMLKPGSASFFEDFVRDVVHERRDPSTWGFQDVIAFVSETGRGGALRMSAREAESLLASIAGERWASCGVDDAYEVNKRRGDFTWGAPGVLVRHAPYWWEPAAKRVAFVVVTEAPATIQVDRFDVAFRRWIALRTSWWAKQACVDLTTAEPEQIAEAIGVSWDQVSIDGAVALAALIREAHTEIDLLTQVHGFVGPDEWFSVGI